LFLACLCWILGPGARAATREDLSLKGLTGTLSVPDNPEAAVVLILPGSGPVDRDGNLPGLRNDSLKLLGDGLLERQIGSLRIDKRGVGGSAAAMVREEDLRIDTYVEDAVAWITYLRQRPSFSRIYLMGHSEGALIATLAARRQKIDGLILMAGAGLPAGRMIERQLVEVGASGPLVEASRRIGAQLVAGMPITEVPSELATLYRPSVQPYMRSWLALDPAGELGQITAPVLILQGSTDLQVSATDAQTLKAAKPDAELVLIDGMNHILRQAPPDRAANFATYQMPDQPLHPSLVPAIGSFLRP
jgi:pimeloyl-ACP methyl ester carboxylesterase